MKILLPRYTGNKGDLDLSGILGRAQSVCRVSSWRGYVRHYQHRGTASEPTSDVLFFGSARCLPEHVFIQTDSVGGQQISKLLNSLEAKGIRREFPARSDDERNARQQPCPPQSQCLDCESRGEEAVEVNDLALIVRD